MSSLFSLSAVSQPGDEMPPSWGGWVDQDGIIRYAQPGENIVQVMMMTKGINYVDEAEDDDDDDDYHDDVVALALIRL